MNCPACGTQNPERARFCMSCGEALPAACPSCGAANPAGAKFCIECGASLTSAPAPAAPAAPEAEGAPPEERRTATVLFADLSGYTAASERVDPERMKSLIDPALRRLGAEVERYGGAIDKFIGDNVMGVFGAPVAHEDDPERAVRAGLAMQAAMEEINGEIAGDLPVDFALRVGINSGEVLAGRVGEGYTVIGDPVNVAARLQAAAEPGSVIVGEVTHRLTRSAIEYVALEPLELKGKSKPVPAWEAVRAVILGRAARAARSSTALIGRDDEAELLLSLYDRVVSEDRAHLVTVIGQAGVGKSRLLQDLTSRVGERDPQPAIRLGSCPAYGSGLAYWALGEVVRGSFDIVDSDDSATAWRKLNGGVEGLLADAEEEESAARIAAVLARALGIERPANGNGGEPAGSDSEDAMQMRDRLFSAVRILMERASARQPLVFAVEDIHWADEGMLDLIEHLARWVRGPALLICLARDELLDRRPGWGGGKINATTVALEPLPAARARELVTALMPAGVADTASGQLVMQVAERSGGNPLFAEEIVNRILEEGGRDTEALPETVHSVLAARLDALPRPERRVLQHGSVVGQTFWVGSLAGVAREEGIDLPAALAALQEKDLVVSVAGSRLADEREYAFKHALVRDVAYSTLPKALRARKHAEVGDFISKRAADRSEGVVAMVAEHYGRAAALGGAADLEPGELERIDARALDALEAAGDASAHLYSNREALGHYETALSLRRALDPAGAARIGEKLGDVALRLGRVDQAVEAWEQCMDYHRREEDLSRVGDLHRKIGAGLWHKGDREASIEHYQSGIDLLKDGPPSLELVRLYEEAASLYMHTGDNMLAIYASEKALRLAERLGEAAAASRAHGIFGRVFGRIGDSERAKENLERSVELRARATRPRACAHCSRSATTSRSRRPTTTAPPRPTARASSSPSKRATCPRRWSSTPRSPGSRSTAATGRRSSARPRPPRTSPSARGSPESSASRIRCEASCCGAPASSTRPPHGWSAPSSSPTRSAARRSPSSRFTGSPSRDATRAGTPMRTRPWPGPSTSASAPDWWRNRWRRSPPARSTRRFGASASRRASSPPRRQASPSACDTRSAAPPASRPAAPPRATPMSASACWPRRGTPGKPSAARSTPSAARRWPRPARSPNVPQSRLYARLRDVRPLGQLGEQPDDRGLDLDPHSQGAAPMDGVDDDPVVADGEHARWLDREVLPFPRPVQERVDHALVTVVGARVGKLRRLDDHDLRV